ncbi:MAG: hypothetical protein AB1486_28350 [Planctomycetota bacterium]
MSSSSPGEDGSEEGGSPHSGGPSFIQQSARATVGTAAAAAFPRGWVLAGPRGHSLASHIEMPAEEPAKEDEGSKGDAEKDDPRGVGERETRRCQFDHACSSTMSPSWST